MKKLSPDHARKLREGAVRARAAKAMTIETRLRAAQAARMFVIAEKWVHEAMREGLVWAVENPDTFLKSGGQTIGVVLTEIERRHVKYVLESLLMRLTSNKQMLWKVHGRVKGKNRKTIERELAEHGARRGW